MWPLVPRCSGGSAAEAEEPGGRLGENVGPHDGPAQPARGRKFSRQCSRVRTWAATACEDRGGSQLCQVGFFRLFF